MPWILTTIIISFKLQFIVKSNFLRLHKSHTTLTYSQGHEIRTPLSIVSLMTSMFIVGPINRVCIQAEYDHVLFRGPTIFMKRSNQTIERTVRLSCIQPDLWNDYGFLTISRISRNIRLFFPQQFMDKSHFQ